MTPGTMMVLLAYVVLTLVTAITHCQASYRNSRYNVWPGYRVVGGSALAERSCAGLPGTCCVEKCLGVDTCTSAAMNTETGLCQLFDSSLSEGNASLAQDDQWRYMEPLSDVVKWGDWVLVFRARADINVSVYTTWYNDDLYHDHPVQSSVVQAGCLSSEASLPCHAHFRSKILTTWTSSRIDLVKFLLLKNSNIVAEILFDGSNTDKTSWFLPERVINSTWTDLAYSTFNYFSITGHPNTRRFFINQDYAGCPDDRGWMTVIDGNDNSHACDWDNPPSTPRFLYSTKTTWARTGNLTDFDYADVMAILVKQTDNLVVTGQECFGCGESTLGG